MSKSLTCARNLPIQPLDWQNSYRTAMSETDTQTLFKLVEIAESAILCRRDTLAKSRNHDVERLDIEDALRTLKLLEETRLKFKSD